MISHVKILYSAKKITCINNNDDSNNKDVIEHFIMTNIK